MHRCAPSCLRGYLQSGVPIGVCVSNVETRKGFQRDPTDARLNEEGERQGTGAGIMLLLRAHPQVGDCFWFWIKMWLKLSKSWRECLREPRSLNWEQMLVRGCPVGEAFAFVIALLLYFTQSLLPLLCAARLSEGAVKKQAAWRQCSFGADAEIFA